jgi:hypothetical protein
MRWTSDFTEVATDATLCPILIAEKTEGAAMCVWKFQLLMRILKGHLPNEEMFEGQLQGADDLFEEDPI